MGITTTKLDIDDWFNSLTENIDLWVTDPPYPFNSQNGTNRYAGMYTRFSWKKLDDIFEKMYNRTNDKGRCYVFCNRDGLFKTIAGLERAGFSFLNILIWDKQHFGGGYHWRHQAEYIVYVSKGRPKTYVKGHPNVFNYKKPTKRDANISIGYSPGGTSPKPLQIWSDIIEWGGCEGDVCADPFAGSDPMSAALKTKPHLMKKIKEAYTNVFVV